MQKQEALNLIDQFIEKFKNFTSMQRFLVISVDFDDIRTDQALRIDLKFRDDVFKELDYIKRCITGWTHSDSENVSIAVVLDDEVLLKIDTDFIEDLVPIVLCPICEENELDPDPVMNALSRKDNQTHICYQCSQNESLGEI